MDITNEIELWFHEHDDGEFAVLPADHVSFHHGDFRTAKTILYVTKAACIEPIVGLMPSTPCVAAIGRYGLPTGSDVQLLETSSSADCLFYGDADPLDLLVFAWLRAHVQVKWAGVCDEFLIRLGCLVDRRIQMKLGGSELAALPRLDQLCSDYRDLVGEHCATMLASGSKIELESVLWRCAGRSEP